MIKAIYAGSFDPVTLGHLDLIYRAIQVFDLVVVAIGINSAKKPLFSTEERIQLLQDTWVGKLTGPATYSSKIEVTCFEGLLVNYCHQNDIKIILRGLRAVTDFEYELGIAHANATQDQGIDTFFMPTKPEFSFVSSSVVRELARHGGQLSRYVPEGVEKALREKFRTEADPSK